jgi:hypothetical protein
MAGQRHRMDSSGSSYEDYAKSLIGRFAALIPVQRERDFGLDFFCQPLVTAGKNTETVTELAALQVKGGIQKLTYGGLDRRGKWRPQQFTWLRSLATPLYLVRVDKDFSSVQLFSLWPIWWIFWQAGHPFRVDFITRGPSSRLHLWQKPECSPCKGGGSNGDGMQWTVDLGPPLLRLTNENLNDSVFRETATAILRTWILHDRLTLMYFHLSVPVVTSISQWSTNALDVRGLGSGISYFWNSMPGMNLSSLCQTISPMLVNLGLNLSSQNDEAAYRLISVLEWIEGRGQLDEVGKGLLDDLRRTQPVTPAAFKDS